MSTEQLEYLTDELKHLVGWGALPHRLADCPTLRLAAEADDAPSRAAAGYVIHSFLKDEVWAVEKPYTLCWSGQSRVIPPEVLRRIYGLLLILEADSKDVTDRRYRTIKLTGLYRCSVETWRRPFGPERDILRHLAESILSHTKISPQLDQAS